MKNLFRLDGRAIVVTGGAGHIGYKVCGGLSDFGASVLCVSSRREQFLGKVESVVCDVADEKEFGEVVGAFAAKNGGRIHGLVNAAARGPRGVEKDMSRDDLNDAIASLFTHYVTCSQSALSYMNPGASIVNFCSMWGLVSPSPEVYLDLKNEPSIAASGAAAAIIATMRYLAVLTAPKGVRINSIVPGWFPKRRGADRPDYMDQITRRVPLGRIGQPQELVGAAVFLLSDASSYMTGQSLVIDGGYTCK